MPKIEIEYNMKDRVYDFFEFLKERVMDPSHEPVRHLVADFVDKFLVVEMKRLETENDIRKVTIEIPKEILLDPLRQFKQSLDEEFKKFLGDESVSAKPESGLDNISQSVSDHEQFAEPGSGLCNTNQPAPDHDQPAVARPRSGNGHKRMKVRDLTDSERDFIRAEFIKVNGQIDEDTCLPIKDKLGKEVSIFQVTGFVSYLHKLIAEGNPNAPKLLDEGAYLSFIQRRRYLWARYNSPKYQAMRTEKVKNQV